MRILEVIAIFQKSAGTSVFCAEVARELAAQGHEVRIAVPDVRAEGMYGAEVPLMTIADAMQESWDVVHIHGIWTPVLTRVQRWATARGIRLVWSPHGMLQTRALRMKGFKKLAGLLLYQWRSLHRANVIHVCSESERRDVSRLHLGVPIVTIPLGVKENAAIGSRSSPDRKTILYLGRINRGKGLVNLLRAWSQVVVACPEACRRWQVKIVGFNEEHHLQELQAEVERLGLTDRVLLGGPVYGAEKDAAYAAADLFVLPSLSENFSAVLLEALVSGVPAITTNGTPWSMLPDVGCGWYVKVGVSELAESLRAAISLPDHQLRTMGQKGKVWAATNFSWPAVGRQTEDLYRAIGK